MGCTTLRFPLTKPVQSILTRGKEPDLCNKDPAKLLRNKHKDEKILRDLLQNASLEQLPQQPTVISFHCDRQIYTLITRTNRICYKQLVKLLIGK